MSTTEKPQLVIMDMLDGIGQLNALLKNIMRQTGTDDVKEAVRLVNSGQYVVVKGAGFDPATFIGRGWSFADEDQLPAAPAGINPEQIDFLDVLREDETSITGQERDKRLRELGRLHLDPDHFPRFWNGREGLPEEWKRIGVITFDARKLRDPRGDRYVLYLYWLGSAWYWSYDRLGDDFGRQLRSGVART